MPVGAIEREQFEARIALDDEFRERMSNVSYTTTIPRELVHKHATESVLLTDVVPLGRTRFLCAGQVPREHRLFNDSMPPCYDRYDLMLIIELARQGGLTVTHRELGVPVSYQTVFSYLEITTFDPEPNEPMTVPSPVLMDLNIAKRYHGSGSDQARRRTDVTLAGLDMKITFVIDELPIATAAGSFRLYPPPEYNAMRAHVRGMKPIEDAPPLEVPAPVDADAVGRIEPDNVVIGDVKVRDGKFDAAVRDDSTHAFFYDHPLDHMPGTLMCEAYRQLAIYAAAEMHDLDPHTAVVTNINSTFTNFGEPELPMRVAASVGEPREGRSDDEYIVRVQLGLSQVGFEISQASVEVTFCAPSE
jgi:hypothetical protein